MKCAVGKCKQSNSKKTVISFYNFPKDDAQRKSWIKFCNRWKTINVKKEKICALHFKKQDFERNLKFEMGFSNRRAPKLKPGAVPTIEPTAIVNKIQPPNEIDISKEIDISNEISRKEFEISNKFEYCDKGALHINQNDFEINSPGAITNEIDIPKEIKVKIINEDEFTNEIIIETPDKDVLHIKQEDFESNSPNVITAIEIPNEIKVDIPNDVELINEIKIEPPNEVKIEISNEFESYDEESISMTIDTKEDNLQQYVKTLEMEIVTLRQENNMLKMLQSQSAIIIKNLFRRIRCLNFTKINLEKSLRCRFTKGQMKKPKKDYKKKNFTKLDIAQSISSHSTRAKAYRLLRKNVFPFPRFSFLSYYKSFLCKYNLNK